MIRETEVIEQFMVLERQVLLEWIDDGVVAPHSDDQGYLFDAVDTSRIALCCDLHYRMGLDHASLPVILSLIDQLHDARHHLRALTDAVSAQPDTVRSSIADHLTSRNGASDPDRDD